MFVHNTVGMGGTSGAQRLEVMRGAPTRRDRVCDGRQELHACYLVVVLGKQPGETALPPIEESLPQHLVASWRPRRQQLPADFEVSNPSHRSWNIRI